MKAAKIITTLYGLLLFLGGFIGYFKAHSTPSLVVAGLSAALLWICAYKMSLKNKAFLYLAIAIIAGLDAFFTYRYMHSLKFFPPGMMSLISLATLFSVAFSLKKRL